MNIGIVKKMKRQIRRNHIRMKIVETIIGIGFIGALWISYILLWAITGRY